MSSVVSHCTGPHKYQSTLSHLTPDVSKIHCPRPFWSSSSGKGEFFGKRNFSQKRPWGFGGEESMHSPIISSERVLFRQGLKERLTWLVVFSRVKRAEEFPGLLQLHLTFAILIPGLSSSWKFFCCLPTTRFKFYASYSETHLQFGVGGERKQNITQRPCLILGWLRKFPFQFFQRRQQSKLPVS